MSLRRYQLENYRCFRDRQTVQIFPVTVVLGKNNSGKSALVRAPLVLATGFGVDTSAPLDLERLGTDAPDGFTDLIFEQVAHRPVRFAVDVVGGQPFGLEATLQYVDERQQAFVSDLSVQWNDVETELHWFPDANGSTDVYRTDDTSSPQRIAFRGLVPLDLAGVPTSLSLGPIRYLSSFRLPIERHHRLPLGERRDLGSRAEHVLGVLAHHAARTGGQLIDVVNEYVNRIVPGWELDEISDGPLYATVLTRSRSRVQVNLADAGSGLAQVLPILVQCALDRIYGDPSRTPLQIIEEPEMHLHPGAHAELADLYLRTARETGTRFLVETHSETLLLRLRRRVAEGDCRPDEVGVYVVEQSDGVSTVRQIDLDSLGNLGDAWPEGYFSQDYHEVRALAAAQLRRSGHAARH
jgi:AAA ATPase domain